MFYSFRMRFYHLYEIPDGRDDNKTTQLTGASGVMKVWASIMKALNIKELNLVTPEEIDWMRASEQTCVEPTLITLYS